MSHTLEKVAGGHRCLVCGWEWAHKPDARAICPNVPRYASPSDELRTATQWRKDKRRPCARQRPAGVYWNSHDYIALWRWAQTEVIPPPTDEERARRRERDRLARTCIGCSKVVKHVRDLEEYEDRHVHLRRICSSCLEAYFDAEAEELQARRDADRAKSAEWARRMLARPAHEWCILDTETTSLDGAIIELAVIDGQGEILVNTRIQPGVPISAGAHAIHGISDDDLLDAPTFPAIYDDLIAALRGRRVVIYNADFDTGRLHFECRR